MPNHFFGLVGGDFGIIQTVGKMKGEVYSAMRDPSQTIRRRVEDILRWTDERDELGEIKAIFHFVQDHFHYVNDPYDIELVKTPVLLDQEVSRQGSFIGDCDDASTYLAALLKSAGYSPAFALAAPKDTGSYDYSHVFVMVYASSKDKWIHLDPTAKGKPFGWAPPSVRIDTYAV